MQGLVFCCRLLLLGNFQAAGKNTLWNRRRKVKHAFVCLEMFITVVAPLLTCLPVIGSILKKMKMCRKCRTDAAECSDTAIE